MGEWIRYENVVITITGLLYISVGISYLIKSEFRFSPMWICWGLANIFYTIALYKKI